MQQDFDECKQCGSEQNYFKDHADLAGVEILLSLNYSRSSQLLGAMQSSMSHMFVKLLKDEGTEVLYTSALSMACLGSAS